MTEKWSPERGPERGPEQERKCPDCAGRGTDENGKTCARCGGRGLILKG